MKITDQRLGYEESKKRKLHKLLPYIKSKELKKRIHVNIAPNTLTFRA